MHSKRVPSHIISFHPDSSLYVFPPTPPCNHPSTLLPPSPTRCSSHLYSTKPMLSSCAGFATHSKSLYIKEPTKKVPRLRLGTFSSIHPQNTLDFRDTYIPTPTTLPLPEFDATSYQFRNVDELGLPSAHIKDNDTVVPSSVKRLKNESLLCMRSILPSCLVFLSFHSSSISSSTPVLDSKQMKWKPYYLTLQPNTEIPILRCHRDQSLSDSSISMWVQLPIDVQCQLKTSMKLTNLELMGKFPFLVQKKLKFRDSLLSFSSKKKKRNTWTRTYAGLSLHFLSAHYAEVWLQHLQHLLVDTTFKVLARVAVQPDFSSVAPKNIIKNTENGLEKNWESELALLHLELKKIQGLQNRG
ncbi:hypothetical protein HMI54_014629 [Coelomomyces lativittatus]|nr:hypothetical protein HMI54_014629 [Coelomomyces lativittatus]